MTARERVQALSAGVVAGLAGGLFGVGGGLILIPILTTVFRTTQHPAQGTSLAIILVTAPAGGIEHARHGNVVMRLVPMLAIGAAIGGPLASWLAQHLPHELLARAFAVFLLLNAAHTWRRAGRARV